MFKREISDSYARAELLKAQEALVLMQRDVRQVMELQAEMLDKLARLRGKIYAHKMHLPDEPEAARESARESKAELLRRAGFTPGRPMVHKDG